MTNIGNEIKDLRDWIGDLDISKAEDQRKVGILQGLLDEMTKTWIRFVKEEDCN